MGEARRRAATREERAAQSIARKARAEEAKREDAHKWWEGLTEEEKESQRKVWHEKDKKRANARLVMAAAMGLFVGADRGLK
jgi:hypothetical protein